MDWEEHASYLYRFLYYLLDKKYKIYNLHIQNMFLQLIISGIMCEIIVCVITFIVFYYSKEMQMMIKILYK